MPERVLRCIGGPSDGRRVSFPGGVDDMPIIDPIPDPTPATVARGSFKSTMYTAQTIKTPDGEIEFATVGSINWALRKQLT